MLLLPLDNIKTTRLDVKSMHKKKIIYCLWCEILHRSIFMWFTSLLR